MGVGEDGAGRLRNLPRLPLNQRRQDCPTRVGERGFLMARFELYAEHLSQSATFEACWRTVVLCAAVHIRLVNFAGERTRGANPQEGGGIL